MKKLNTKKGFSLIELLVVIAIIGVLSAVGITAYTGYTASAKEQAARTQFAQAVSLINAEMAKCSVGSGDYQWPSGATKDACSDGIHDDEAANTIADFLVNGLGFRNPYDNVTTTIATTGNADGAAQTEAFIYVLATVADPENDGDIVIKDTSDTATNIEIRQRVNSTTVLTQTIEAAS